MKDTKMDNKEYFPCPICKKMLIVELTKNEKPYCTCNDCGVQLFIRGKEGINRFKKLTGKSKIEGNAKDLINTIDYFNELNKLLEEVKMKKPILWENKDLNLQEKVIKNQLNQIREKLKEEQRTK